MRPRRRDIRIKFVRILAHGVPTRVVAQQADDLLTNRLRVAERHQHAAPVGQQFGCVPVGSRNYRFAGAKRVG
jgi:hypothetical protein